MQRFADWFRDSEGRGYPGALVTVYESGTSNKPQLYNAGGSISSPAPISNPTFTDSNGYFAFAVPNGTNGAVCERRDDHEDINRSTWAYN